MPVDRRFLDSNREHTQKNHSKFPTATQICSAESLEHSRNISLRWLVVGAVAVCILSAGIATGATLLIAERGPQGPPGEQGSHGPRGPEGPEGYVDVDALDLDFIESEVSEVRDAVESVDSDLGWLESDLSSVESNVSELCSALDTFC
jgi:hypothetical protein